MLICRGCFGESEVLDKHLEARGTIGTCPTCECDNVRVAELAEITDLFEGLQRHYEPLIGDPYRLGKYGIEGLGSDPNEISLVERLRHEWHVFSEFIDDSAADEILKMVWPGYIGGYLRRPDGDWLSVENKWNTLKKSLMHERRFLTAGTAVGSVVAELLDPWCELLKADLEKNRLGTGACSRIARKSVRSGRNGSAAAVSCPRGSGKRGRHPSPLRSLRPINCCC